MSLDDIVNGVKKDTNTFLGRNGNLFFSTFGLVFGVIDGLASPYPPSVVGTAINSYFMCGLILPTVNTIVYSYMGIDTSAAAKKFFLEQGPENTVSYGVTYFAVSNGVYALKKGILG